mgnify:CR=1 FL=1
MIVLCDQIIQLGYKGITIRTLFVPVHTDDACKLEHTSDSLIGLDLNSQPKAATRTG